MPPRALLQKDIQDPNLLVLVADLGDHPAQGLDVPTQLLHFFLKRAGTLNQNEIQARPTFCRDGKTNGHGMEQIVTTFNLDQFWVEAS